MAELLAPWGVTGPALILDGKFLGLGCRPLYTAAWLCGKPARGHGTAPLGTKPNAYRLQPAVTPRGVKNSGILKAWALGGVGTPDPTPWWGGKVGQ